MMAKLAKKAGNFAPMFDKLQKKWGVSPAQVVIILIIFALGGSLCGFLGRKILLLTTLEKNFWWYCLYILLVTLLWPMCVLLVSIPFGQFRFFRNYIAKLGKRIVGK